MVDEHRSLTKAGTIPKRDLDHLTRKQQLFIQKYIEYRNATKAAMEVYECKDEISAASVGSENLRKLQIVDLMESYGLTDLKLFDKLIEGLEATKIISARITGKDANERTDDFIDIPDYATRHKYLDTAFKLKKRLNNDTVAIQTNITLPSWANNES